MEKIKLFVATHKKASIPKIKGYIPIQVGAELNQELGYLKDNEAQDNISEKNKNFCELTALYYIWKNEKDIEIIGLTHCRRYFFYDMFSISMFRKIKTKKVKKIMQEYDIILPEPFNLENETVYSHYEKYHNIKDYEKCREIIKQKYEEYLNAFDIISERNYIYPYNMFILKKEDFDNYMEWLFDILFELEKKTDISNYDSYNKRIYGFLSERLLNVWVEKNNLKIKRLPVYNVESKTLIGEVKNALMNRVKII